MGGQGRKSSSPGETFQVLVTGGLFDSSLPETADGDGSWQGKSGRRPFSRRGQIAERVLFCESLPSKYCFDPHLA